MKEESPEQQSPKPNTSKSPLCDKKTARKLSKKMRIASIIYQNILVLIGGVMFCLTHLNRNGIKINEIMFKASTVLCSVFPVVYTNLLNLFKKSVIEKYESK